MIASTLLAISGLLVASNATPINHATPQRLHHRHHAERDLVWVTETFEAVVTIPVTETIYLSPGEPIPTGASGSDSSVVSFSAIASTTPHTSTTSPTSTSPVASTSTSTTSTSTSTSVYIAPTTSSSTSSIYSPPTTQAPAPTTSSSSSSSSQPGSSSSSSSTTSSSSSSSSGSNGLSGLAASGTSYTGDLTYYDPSIGMSACGTISGTSDPIVALSHVIFSTYPRDPSTGNPVICNKQITITGKDGNPYTATIVDMCPGCDEGSLDLSQGFFNKVTSNGDGRVSGMHWSFN